MTMITITVLLVLLLLLLLLLLPPPLRDCTVRLWPIREKRETAYR